VWNIAVQGRNDQFPLTMRRQRGGDSSSIGEGLAQLILQQFVPWIQRKTLGPVFC
jgi:hypothetical protein